MGQYNYPDSPGNLLFKNSLCFSSRACQWMAPSDIETGWDSTHWFKHTHTHTSSMPWTRSISGTQHLHRSQEFLHSSDKRHIRCQIMHNTTFTCWTPQKYTQKDLELNHAGKNLMKEWYFNINHCMQLLIRSYIIPCYFKWYTDHGQCTTGKILL